ncbi:MAG: hypothetical protein WBD40_03540 [Tepidisphaeraceae bacterium]
MIRRVLQSARSQLASLLGVDGAGSGLDADQLDGAEGAAYQTRSEKDQPNGYPGLNGDGDLVGTFIPRKGTQAETDGIVLGEGEIALITNGRKSLRFGDGITAGGQADVLLVNLNAIASEGVAGITHSHPDTIIATFTASDAFGYTVEVVDLTPGVRIGQQITLVCALRIADVSSETASLTCSLGSLLFAGMQLSIDAHPIPPSAGEVRVYGVARFIWDGGVWVATYAPVQMLHPLYPPEV